MTADIDRQDVTRVYARWAPVYDFVFGAVFARARRAAIAASDRVGGRILTCGATAGYNPMEDLRYIWTFELQVRGSNSYGREDIENGLELVASGQLKPHVDAILPLAQAAEGLRRLEERKVFGKLVIVP